MRSHTAQNCFPRHAYSLSLPLTFVNTGGYTSAMTTLLIAASFLACSSSFIEGFNAPKFMLLGLASVAGLIYAPRRAPVGAYVVWAILFATLTLAALTGIDPWASIFGGKFTGWETPFLLAVMFGIWTAGLQARNTITLENILLAGAAIAAGYGVLQASGSKIIFVQHMVNGRATGLMGSAPYFAQTLALSLALCIFRRYWILSAVLAAGLIASRSRGPILAVIIVHAILYSRGYLRGYLRYLVFLACAAGVAFSINSHNPSDSMRIIQGSIAIRAWLAHPWLGWGPGNFVLAMGSIRTLTDAAGMGGLNVYQGNAHFFPLEVLTSSGILGALAWSIFIYYMLKTARGPALPALFTLALCALTNPIHPVTYAVFAILHGMNYPRNFLRYLHNPLVIILAMLAIGLGYIQSRLTLADFKARHGQLHLACKLAPNDLLYPYLYAVHSGNDPRILNKSIDKHPNSPMAYQAAMIYALRINDLKAISAMKDACHTLDKLYPACL